MGIYQKDGNWFIDYYANGRRKREKIGSSRKLAEMVLAKRKIEIAENRFLDIKKDKKIKFAKLADTFLNNYSRINNRGHKKNVSLLKKIGALWGDIYISEITPLMIEKYKSARLEKVKPATINRELNVLGSMFNRAIEWGMMSENPVKNVKKFVVDNRRVRFLSLEEINRLLEASSEDLYGILVVALNTGMRKGEILRLKWKYIDFQNGMIYLPSELSKNKYRREIPMNSVLMATLKKLHETAEGEYVFHGRFKDGKPPIDVRKSFAAALKKAGIEDFRFHDLRHTFCSQLVASGVDIYTVMELAGHRSIKMTMRYAHLAPGQKKDAVEILARKMDTFWTPGEKSGDKVCGTIDKNDMKNQLKNDTGLVAQLVRASRLHRGGQGFESSRAHFIPAVSGVFC